MSQSKWDDLYDRLTSRKLLLCLTSVVLAIWGYHAGIIDGDRMMSAISVAVTAYTAAEGASDAVAAWRSKPADAITEAAIRLRAERLAQEHAERPALREVGRG